MKNTLSALLLASAGILAAAPVLEIRRAEDFSFPAWAAKSFSNTPEGTVKVLSRHAVSAESRVKIDLDMNKTYKISGRIRKIPGTEGETFFWIGIIPFNGDGVRIPSSAVNLSPGNITELTAPAKKGETQLAVKHASGWNGKNAPLPAPRCCNCNRGKRFLWTQAPQQRLWPRNSAPCLGLPLLPTACARPLF